MNKKYYVIVEDEGFFIMDSLIGFNPDSETIVSEHKTLKEAEIALNLEIFRGE